MVAIWFPRLAMEHWQNRHDGFDASQPFALASEGPHGMVIDGVSDCARRAGAKPGQRLTDARAICPELAIHPSDPAADARRLERLGLWAQRWSPWTAVDGKDGLLLDSTGASHLFGNENDMLRDMNDAFSRQGFISRTAIAPTIGGAWALAHFGASTSAVLTQETLAPNLAVLPIEALRIGSDVTLLLRRLGLKTIGSLADIPTQALARRFRKYRHEIANPLKRLQQAYGDREEVVEPLIPRALHRAVKRVTEPVRHTAILQPILHDLALELCQSMEASQRGLRRTAFHAFRVDGHIARIEVETAAAVRCPQHIVRLFSERTEKLEAGFGFDTFAMTAVWHETMPAIQKGLAEDEDQNGTPLPHLLDRLRIRLGKRNVGLLAAHASHIPERAIIQRSSIVHAVPTPDCAANLAEQHQRPLKLLDWPEPIMVIYATPDGPPRRFRWRGQLHDVIRSQGPERIAPEWWRERSSVRLRDYYRVEDSSGRRLWIYRNGVVDDGRGAPPLWFLHGLFA
jgi:protein ImuB